jgi:hypothetical protein
MRSNRRHKPILIALYVNAAIMLGILMMLLSGRSPVLMDAAWAQNQLPIGGGAGVFIVPAQFSDRSFGCYIMDVDSQTLCAYQYYEKQLRLVAARNFRWDRRLGQFNSTNPTPQEVQQMVEAETQDARVKESPRKNVDPEAPVKPQ